MSDNPPATNVAPPAEPVIPLVRMSMEDALDKINVLEASQKPSKPNLKKSRRNATKPIASSQPKSAQPTSKGTHANRSPSRSCTRWATTNLKP